MLAPSFYKVPSAASSSLTHQRIEADPITGERTQRSQCLFETEGCAGYLPNLFFFFFFIIIILDTYSFYTCVPLDSAAKLTPQKSSAAG